MRTVRNKTAGGTRVLTSFVWTQRPREVARDSIGNMSAPHSPTDPFQSAVSLRDALLAREISAVQATEHFLERITEASALGAFITVTSESALDEARSADARITEEHAATHRAGRAVTLPPLIGLPIAHKDIIEVAGVPTTFGSASMGAGAANADHPVVAALRESGTVSLGKTQVPELGLNSYSENLIADPARNPFDMTRTPGGSSGGSAAAVAAGLLPVAPGSDGGGSIRIPALACGLVGLKPGLGTVPGDVAGGREDTFGGPRLTVHGPLAHSAADAALLMDAMIAGGAEPGAQTPNQDAVRRADALVGARIAMSDVSPFAAAFDTPLSPEARLAYETAASRLAGLGHHIEPTEFEYDPEYAEFFTEGWISSLSLLEFDDAALSRLTPLTREFFERARARSTEEHRESAARMQQFGADAREMWSRTDFVLTPGLAMDAPRIGEFMALTPNDDYRLQCQWTPYTSMVNVSGLPAIAVPILTTDAGMPMGAQLIGRPGSEPQLLALAEQLMSMS